MVQERVIVGIDVGTTKICVLVGELDRDGKMNIVGVGTCHSQGLRRGVVVNIEETVTSIAAFFFSSRRRHTRSLRDWSSDVCSSDLKMATAYAKNCTFTYPCVIRIRRSDISALNKIGRASVGKECRSRWAPYH